MSTKIVDMNKILLYIIYAQLERSVCMAVKIRLTRMGATKRPSYRIVATDSRKARDGEYIEQIGFYNPLTQDHYQSQANNLTIFQVLLNLPSHHHQLL